MSLYATPFIVINLGCEMVFVVEQRLKAQNISLDKAERVLTDIVTILLHSKLLDELFIPQPVAKHSVIKQLLQDISQTSIMKLDEYSMSKLWDLMTMIFKWQLFVGTNQNIFDISRRHLKSVAMLLPSYFPKITIEQTMKRLETVSQRLTDEDYLSLITTINVWFSQYYIKISILMRLCLQKKDGTFFPSASINSKILKNLGENIYLYDTNKNSNEDYECPYSNTSEIKCLLSPIEQVLNRSKITLILPMELGKNQLKKKTLEIDDKLQFQNISISVKAKPTDLSFNPEVSKSLQDDLLKMIDEASE